MNKLWIVGCSIAHGVGVNPGQRWGDIVAHKLDIVPTFLTAEGSSIEWAADQILQANISKDDIVCWGLTSPNRSLWYNDSGSEYHILNAYYQNNPNFQNVLDKRHLVDLNLAHKAVNYVKQVQNYLNKIGCQYAIGYTLPGLIEHQAVLLDNLYGTSNFFIAYNKDLVKPTPIATFLTQSRPSNNIYVDVGHDGYHPGPLQHQLYATQFLEMLGK